MSTRRPILDPNKDAVAGYLFAGRTHEEHVDSILREGVHGSASTIRKLTLQCMGVPGPKEKAENVVMFGCYPIHSEYSGMESFVRLLNRLDIDYTYLEKEYCCGGFLSHLFTGPKESEKAADASKSFVGMNIAAAREHGAKRMVYGCAPCVYVVKSHYPDETIEQAYRFDVLVDKLRQRDLRMKPATVGYFEGCHIRYKDTGVKLDWSVHREAVGRIEGLEIVDLPRTLCCLRSPERIVEAVVRRNLHTVVCPINCCIRRLERILKEAKVKVVYMEELFLEALNGANGEAL